MIAVSFECCKCPTTPFPVIDILVVVTMSYICNTSKVEPCLAVRYLLEFFLTYKTPDCIYKSNVWHVFFYLYNTVQNAFKLFTFDLGLDSWHLLHPFLKNLLQ